MPLMPEHEKYHKLSPRDLKFGEKPVMNFGVARTTAMTGEQLHVDCPVYMSDSREDVLNRLGFCYSIIQERLEDENKAVRWIDERVQKAARAHEKIKSLKALTEAEIKRVKKATKDLVDVNGVNAEVQAVQEKADKDINELRMIAAHAAHEKNSGKEIDFQEFAETVWPELLKKFVDAEGVEAYAE
jgi:hypothetical protein